MAKYVRDVSIGWALDASTAGPWTPCSATFVLQLQQIVSPAVQIKSARIGSCAPECVDKAPAFCPNAELFASVRDLINRGR